MNCEHGARAGKQSVPVIEGFEKQRGEGGVPVVAVKDLGRPLHALATDEHGAREGEKSQVLVRIGRVQGLA